MCPRATKERIMKKVIVCVCVLAALATGCNNKGIVTLEGYKYGVAFCESEYSYVVHPKDASVWSDSTATYVVNKGHYSDPQVSELAKLAEKECN